MPKNSRLSYNLGAKSREFVTIPQAVAIADKGKDKFGAFLKGVTDKFPYPEDFYADARWNKSSRPWKILVTVDNFKTIKVGKPADKPKNLRAKGRQRDARMVDVGNYKLWFDYTISIQSLGAGSDPEEGLGGIAALNTVTDISNAHYTNATYSLINEPGRQWIRKYTLALSK